MKFVNLKRPGWAKLFIAGALALTMSATANAGPYLLMDLGSGRVIAQENAFQRWYPASLTKLMTAYVAFRMIRNGDATMQTPVTITAAAAKLPPAKMGYPVGSQLTLETALKIIMVKSANDVARSIADSLAGSEELFAAWMNAEAGRLGMTDTHFVNAHGLHSPQQYTTARDLAILTRAIRTEFPQYVGLFSIEGIQSGKSKMPNGNPLVGRFAGTDGMKTGYICASGFNLVSTATRNGRTLAAVVLGSLSQTERAETAAALLAEGFKRGGGSGTPISNLQRGRAVSGPVDISQSICTAEAAAKRNEKRDKKGRLVFSSPHLSPMAREPRLIQVGLLNSGVTIAKTTGGTNAASMIGQLVNVPLPTPRPDYAPMAYGQGG